MDDDDESYAPVVSWSTVRFFLIIAIMLGWHTVSVDWSNAFIHAKLKEPMYMATPRGFTNQLYGALGCLCVTKSLYGSKFAPRNWYVHLRSALLQLGMKESPIDKCLFHRENLLMVLYVDDAGIAAPKKSMIEAFVEELRELHFDLDIQDDFSSYLGIGIETASDGTRHMTQKGLIKKIVNITGLQDCNPNWTPTAQVSLSSNPDGEPYDQQEWSYPSVVGMLLYLSNNTRPDITFSVSQVARFTSNPKKSHAVALKRTGRYLAKTWDKGLHFKPDSTYNLRCWVDADFAGLFGSEPSENPDSARSRYGYIITFGGVPLIWKSQLISEICLSTLHAEYVGLTNALRALIPIRSMVTDTLNFLHLPSSQHPEVHCTVFEDNQGAYLLATNQRLSVRTKYFCVKHHFFWSYVYDKRRNPDGWLVVVKSSTDLQNADMLTKGLVCHLFESNRLRVQGW
uniref:Reverse transcriptase Ty1/copia-type domain-containing protein n=2 Tax=Pseudo-nitzschia australis TaxID=44445 RepID=A0A7S4AV79_9STRA|mmetsp:Transcript_1852/g.3705  ORF Transcript_1852/g.3705 Transcript_1852/m.3705 type:complete len:455 (+) Transcript_1852:123-1487(+)